VSVPTRHSNPTRTPYSKHSSGSRTKHQLASSVLSDSDSVDSPTYDGDIESSTTAGLDSSFPSRPTHHHHASSASTLNMPTTSSTSTPVVEDSTLLLRANKPDINHPGFLTQPFVVSAALEEPAVPEPSKSAFDPAALTAEEIQAFVQKAIDGESWRKYKINPPPQGRPVRVYADGKSLATFFERNHTLQVSMTFSTLGRRISPSKSK
jgi:choline-phosphate cytidylyltransferase